MDNLNISFAPDKSAEDKGRINAVEDYLSLLTERIKFCFNGIDESIAHKSDGEEEKQLIYSTIADEVGQFTDTDRNCEVFNDYKNNVASAYYSHAEGYKTTASAPYSHAEGKETTASNEYTHAEGRESKASGTYSHAEGGYTQAIGTGSHAEGYYTVAGGEFSHASGVGTQAGSGVFAIGRWNKTASDVLFVVGNGWNTAPGDESTAYRSDAMVLDISGNLHVAGKLTADGGVEYVLPTATAYTIGGVKIGDNISVTADGVISVNLSAYLKADEISDWAKADSKPTYTAAEVGAAAENHTHRYDASESIAGQTIDLDDLSLNEDTDKGTVHRYSCGVSAAQNISNRPTAVNEPFCLDVRNIKSAATSYVTQQKYISPSRRKEYVRWCADGVWSAWQATDNRTIYGTIAPGTTRSYSYTTYGEGYGKIKLTAMYGADEGSNMVNIKAATLVSDSAFERNMLTVGASVFKINITDGNVTLSVAEGTASFSYELMYFN